jgi:hypothetical protein
VFTARYALSPYINQIRFVFKGLNSSVESFMKTRDVEFRVGVGLMELESEGILGGVGVGKNVPTLILILI